MPYYCTVPRCTSMAGKAKNVSFHQFPRDEELAKLWNKILKRGKPYTKYSKVCSLHFTPEDYTITSVGKNKGQWRTLRKDAIPSQNLPSESPTPYQRKQWGSWSHNAPANILDPTIQHQMAQAIYMQTMLAMQVAGAAEIPALTHSNGLPQNPAPNEAYPHTSNTPDTDILKGKQTNTNEKNTSYKCTECSKCFKDPDVFILHKRSHMNNVKTEKENFNLNLTLQANPILANLLKTNTENANIFDSNVFSMENLLMTALAANMEGYMRSLNSMIKHEDRNDINHDTDDSSHDIGNIGHTVDLNHDRGSLSHERDETSRDTDGLGRSRDDLNHDRGLLSHERGGLGRSVGDLNHDRGQLSHDGDGMRRDSGHLSHNISSFGQDVININRGSTIPNGDHSSQNSPQNHDSIGDSDEINHDRGNTDHDNSIINNHRVNQSNRDSDPNNDLSSVTDSQISDRNLFRDRIIELYRNSDAYDERNVRYYENDRGNSDDRNDDKRVICNDETMISDDRINSSHITKNDNNSDGIPNDNDSQGSDGPICDSDLSESVDSNNLVIDETV